MYLMDQDAYVCDLCGYVFKWGGADEQYGNIWECEDCGQHFCTACFEKRLGTDAFRNMLQNDSLVRCPDCFISQEETAEQYN